MPIAYIAIGSNLGDRETNCERAIELIARQGITVSKRSTMIETNPWGLKDQPLFINMAIEIETRLKPEELLYLLKKIEKELGRTETGRWGPRVIDLDILFYDEIVIDIPELQIPHPHIASREFVLKPLVEIAPDKIHPILNKSVRILLYELLD